MGILEFLGLRKPAIKELRPDQVATWLAEWSQESREQAKKDLLYIVRDIKEAKIELQDSLEALENAKLMNANIPARHKQIMEGNREGYLSKARKLLEVCDVPEDLEELLPFCIEFQVTLGEFGKTSLKAYQILGEFFKDEVKTAANKMGKLHDQVKKVSALVHKSGVEKVGKIQKLLKTIQEAKILEKDFSVQIEKQEGIVKAVEEIRLRTVQGIQELKEGTAHTQYKGLLKQKEELHSQIRDAEKAPFHSFSVIEAALKKYERLTLERKLVASYLLDPIHALSEDSELQIVNILVKVQGVIEQNKLELKDKKREKILQELTTLNRDFFERFLEKHAELHSNLNLLDKVISQASVAEDIKTLEEKAENYRREKAQEVRAKEDLERKKEHIDSERLQETLREALQDLTPTVKLL